MKRFKIKISKKIINLFFKKKNLLKLLTRLEKNKTFSILLDIILLIIFFIIYFFDEYVDHKKEFYEQTIRHWEECCPKMLDDLYENLENIEKNYEKKKVWHDREIWFEKNTYNVVKQKQIVEATLYFIRKGLQNLANDLNIDSLQKCRSKLFKWTRRIEEIYMCNKYYWEKRTHLNIKDNHFYVNQLTGYLVELHALIMLLWNVIAWLDYKILLFEKTIVKLGHNWEEDEMDYPNFY